jgi:hypothetical protein
MTFSVVYCDPDGAIFAQKMPKNFQACSDETKPKGMFDSVVVMLKSGTCIVRRVNIDALDLAGELLFERFEGKKVVTEDEAVIEKVVVGDSVRGVVGFVGIF